MKTAVATPTVSFASKLYPYMGKVTENSFFSPFSIQVALGMTQAGANGDTLAALANLLESPTDKEEAKAFYKKLVDEVNSKEERPYELTTANALWGQVGYNFKPDYVKTVKDYYDGNFEEVNYVEAPKQAVDTINSWCDKNTRGKIPTIISEDFVNKDTRLVLTNAIYFKGKWTVQFDNKNTKDDNFFSPDGNKPVPTMHMTSAFRYYEDEECQALDLPYKGDNLSMLVLLPKVVLETPDLVDKYNTVTDNLRYESEVILSLPRFKLTTNYKLGDTLKKLGAEVAFSDAADFSGIGDDALKISEVIHKAFVQCDEEGTEAAAATVVGMVRMTSMIQPRPPKVFNVNHPFVFFICNKKSGNVLFCGRVTNPGE